MSCSSSLRGERIVSVTTSPVLVLSKSVTLVKKKLQSQGLYSSKQAYAGDGLRFRYSGRDRLTSTIDCDITPYVFFFCVCVCMCLSDNYIHIKQIRTAQDCLATNLETKL